MRSLLFVNVLNCGWLTHSKIKSLFSLFHGLTDILKSISAASLFGSIKFTVVRIPWLKEVLILCMYVPTVESVPLFLHSQLTFIIVEFFGMKLIAEPISCISVTEMDVPVDEKYSCSFVVPS